MKKNLFSIALVLLIGLVTLCSCNEVKFDEKKKTLVVGLECDYPPFNWTETTDTDTNVAISGQNSMWADGYDIQIALLLCQKLGYKLEVKKIDFSSLILGLNSGMIDCVIAGMSPTDKRKQSINFTDEYYRSTHVVLMKNDSEYINALTFQDLSNAKVVGQKATLFDTLAKQLSEKNKAVTYLNPLETVPEIVNAINSGIADISILEEPVAKSIIKNNPSYTYVKLDSEFDLEESDIIVSIGVRKVDTELLKKLNQALSTISLEKRNELMSEMVNRG